MVIFGGFMNLTKELKDLYLFDFYTHTWIKIFQELSAVGSPLTALRLVDLDKSNSAHKNRNQANMVN